MAAFEHVTTLLSFVYALTLTHLLSRVGELIVARKRVRFSGLLALAMFNIGFLVFTNWITIWDLRSVTSWDIASISGQFALGAGSYLCCAVIAPDVPPDGPFDMEAYFEGQRIYYYGALLVLLVVAMLGNASFLKSANVSYFLQQNLWSLTFFLPLLLGFFVRRHWAQWVAGVGFLVLTFSFLVNFDATLH